MINKTQKRDSVYVRPALTDFYVVPEQMLASVDVGEGNKKTISIDGLTEQETYNW